LCEVILSMKSMCSLGSSALLQTRLARLTR